MKLDPLLGEVIDDRYVISARIARGGMATVYQASDRRLERKVAIKVIHAHLAEQPDFVRRFISEARAAAGLSSQHVVAVHDQADVTREELHASCAARLAGFKVPKEFLFIDQIRRLGNGKADYRWAKSVSDGRVMT